jgi:hypothetical protein
MGVQFQAVNIKAPQGDGVANTNVLRFTCSNASKCNALPSTWAGKYIYIYNEDAVDAEVFFSKNASAAASNATGSSDAGAGAATMGGRVRASGERHMRVPSIVPGESLYFVRICASSATLRLELASD